MSARDLTRLEAVVGILTGGSSDTFEDMCDPADAQRNQGVDSCVDDLPTDQRAAIYRRYLSAVFRMRDYETAIVLAHEALEVALRRKGMMW